MSDASLINNVVLITLSTFAIARQAAGRGFLALGSSPQEWWMVWNGSLCVWHVFCPCLSQTPHSEITLSAKVSSGQIPFFYHLLEVAGLTQFGNPWICSPSPGITAINNVDCFPAADKERHPHGAGVSRPHIPEGFSVQIWEILQIFIPL